MRRCGQADDSIRGQLWKSLGGNTVGDRIAENFQLQKCVSAGDDHERWTATDTSGQHFRASIIRNPSEDAIDTLQRLAKCDHEHLLGIEIVQAKDAIGRKGLSLKLEDPGVREITIVSRLPSHLLVEDLPNKRAPLLPLLRAMEGAVEAIDQVHTAGLAFREISVRSFVVSRGKTCIDAFSVLPTNIKRAEGGTQRNNQIEFLQAYAEFRQGKPFSLRQVSDTLRLVESFDRLKKSEKKTIRRVLKELQSGAAISTSTSQILHQISGYGSGDRPVKGGRLIQPTASQSYGTSWQAKRANTHDHCFLQILSDLSPSQSSEISKLPQKLLDRKIPNVYIPQIVGRKDRSGKLGVRLKDSTQEATEVILSLPENLHTLRDYLQSRQHKETPYRTAFNLFFRIARTLSDAAKHSLDCTGFCPERVHIESTKSSQLLGIGLGALLDPPVAARAYVDPYSDDDETSSVIYALALMYAETRLGRLPVRSHDPAPDTGDRSLGAFNFAGLHESEVVVLQQAFNSDPAKRPFRGPLGVLDLMSALNAYAVGDEPGRGYVLTDLIHRTPLVQHWSCQTAQDVGPNTRQCKITSDLKSGTQEFIGLESIKSFHHDGILLLQYWLNSHAGKFGKSLNETDGIKKAGELVIVYRKPVGSLLGERFTCEQLYLKLATIADAIDSLHKQAIGDLDVRPENILRFDDQADSVRLLPFGVGRIVLSEEFDRTRKGLYEDPHSSESGRKTQLADIYSLALTWAELRLGRHPLHRVMDQNELSAAKANLEFDLTGLPEHEIRVLEDALASNAKHRRHRTAVALLRRLQLTAHQGYEPHDRPVPGEDIELVELLRSEESFELTNDEQSHPVESQPFGEVWRAKDVNGKQLALRIIPDLAKRDGSKDFESLGKTSDMSPFLLGCDRYWLKTESGTHGNLVEGNDYPDELIIAMELCPLNLRTWLKQHRGRKLHDEFLGLMKKIAKGIDELNSQGIIHNFVTPSTVLLKDKDVVISDAEVYKVAGNLTATDETPSCPYQDPAVGAGTPFETSDLYSLAMIYAEARLERFPLSGSVGKEIDAAKLAGDFDFGYLQDKEKLVLRQALDPIPGNRGFKGKRKSQDFVRELERASKPRNMERYILTISAILGIAIFVFCYLYFF